jgi:hypothetical protein
VHTWCLGCLLVGWANPSAHVALGLQRAGRTSAAHTWRLNCAKTQLYLGSHAVKPHIALDHWLCRTQNRFGFFLCRTQIALSPASVIFDKQIWQTNKFNIHIFSLGLTQKYYRTLLNQDLTVVGLLQPHHYRKPNWALLLLRSNSFGPALHRGPTPIRPFCHQDPISLDPLSPRPNSLGHAKSRIQRFRCC